MRVQQLLLFNVCASCAHDTLVSCTRCEQDVKRLHAGYGHSALRAWHNPPKLDAAQLVYPIFISQAVS